MIAKTGDHTFSMDVNYPLSPRVAMGVVNSSFDFKWVCQWLLMKYLYHNINEGSIDHQNKYYWTQWYQLQNANLY